MKDENAQQVQSKANDTLKSVFGMIRPAPVPPIPGGAADPIAGGITHVERAAVIRAVGEAIVPLYNHYGKDEAREEAGRFMEMLLSRLER